MAPILWIVRSAPTYSSSGVSRKPIVVFNDMSFQGSRGDRIAVTGPNGVGKSTMLKLMVGAFHDLDEDTRANTFKPDAGEIRWGHDTSVGGSFGVLDSGRQDVPYEDHRGHKLDAKMLDLLRSF